MLKRILDHRVDKDGGKSYWCEFEGWEPHWEPEAALYDDDGKCLCPDSLREYEEFRRTFAVDPPQRVAARRLEVPKTSRFTVTPEQLQGHVEFVASKARAGCTAAAYAKLWNEVVVPFAAWQDLEPFDLQQRDVENILVWHEMSGNAGQVERLAAAMKITYAQHPDDTKGGVLPWSPLAHEIVLGAKRIYAEEKDSVDRHPFPMTGVEQLSAEMIRRKYPNRMKWIRDRAMIAVGMRAIRRPAELSALQCKHIKWVPATDPKWTHKEAPPGLERSWLSIFVPKQKNDKAAIGQWVLIEPTWSPHCAARSVYEYTAAWRIAIGPTMSDSDARFLRSLNDHSPSSTMSTASINSAVKQAAQVLGIKENVTGHSLRIGGATAMAAAKVPMEIIKSIGGWFSETMCQYIRAQAAPGHSVSTAMGF